MPTPQTTTAAQTPPLTNPGNPLFPNLCLVHQLVARTIRQHPSESGSRFQENSNIPSISYDEAIDCALCYGWIDGQRKALDSLYFLQRFTPEGRTACGPSATSKKVAALT
ncbi:uncharacterized protein QC763_0101850 [Podospora pseudopauciseta]|uniref:Uncharacterized protein n=1 Tax=Podospora pseudopauciseta TaxID=2093780 RepID=A0ABR0GZV0_9PEZI|nr:hypothetical protein QC763_0101850 [Podospora pseudopauciseta]